MTVLDEWRELELETGTALGLEIGGKWRRRLLNWRSD